MSDIETYRPDDFEDVPEPARSAMVLLGSVGFSVADNLDELSALDPDTLLGLIEAARIVINAWREVPPREGRLKYWALAKRTNGFARVALRALLDRLEAGEDVPPSADVLGLLLDDPRDDVRELVVLLLAYHNPV